MKINQPLITHKLVLLLIFILMNSSTAYAKKEASTKPVFKLTQGQGTEVCEAYLQRLNATEFLDNDPTKGALSEPLFKGFADLKTAPLTVDEVLSLYNKFKSFEQYQDQNLHNSYYEKYNALHKYDTGFKPEGQGYLYNIKKSMVEYNRKPFVRYQEMLDLDNDGKATDTVIKTTRDKDDLYMKGLFIVDNKLQQVEEARMKAIFADQEILQWPSVTQFPPLASSIDVFSYNGKYYFDGFLDVVLSSHSPSVTRYSPVILGVFMHEHYQTQKICEYQWINGKAYPITKYINRNRFVD